MSGPNFAGGQTLFGLGDGAGKSDEIDLAEMLFIRQKKDMADMCCPNLNPKYYVVGYGPGLSLYLLHEDT